MAHETRAVVEPDRRRHGPGATGGLADLGRVTMQVLTMLPETRDVTVALWPKRFAPGTLGAHAAVDVGRLPRARGGKN